jgi:transcriptional regulator with XRE-family HTH domain
MNKPADLRLWLDERKMSLPDFASTIGVTVKGIRLWLAGKSFPRDPQCDKLFTVTSLDCFGPGRTTARAEHERLIPADVKRERREKYNANPELYRGRALKSWRKRYDASAQFVNAEELKALRADPRKRKNVCRECGEILADVGPHLSPAHDIDVVKYKEKWGFLRSRNATRSEQTQERQSAAIKRSGHQPPKWTHEILPTALAASLQTNKPGSARLERRLNSRRSLAARPKHWKRTETGDLVRDARIASLRLKGLSTEQIAERVGMTLTPVFFRLRRMHLPRRARVFLHGEAVRARRLRCLCPDFNITRQEAAELLGITYDWYLSAAKERVEEPALSWDLGRKYLAVRRDLLRRFRMRPASALGGRPKQLPESERAELLAKYEALLADLQGVRQWVRSQRRLSQPAFWDWLCREFRSQHFRVLHIWPSFFDWVEKNYENSAFLSGDWTPRDLAVQFLADDFDVKESFVANTLTHKA